jgi:hypothetical protein
MLDCVPSGEFHLQSYPGATTAIAIGPLPAEALALLPPVRALLWIAAETSVAPPLPAGTTLHRATALTRTAVAPELERLLRLDARHLPSVLTPLAVDPELIPVIALVADVLEQNHRARVTRQRDGFRWQQHVLANLGAYARQPLPATWANSLSGRPAVVCGAGPSLDVSAARLAPVAEQVVIFAADSALHTLAKHGITADFVVSVDVAKEPAKCLPAGYIPRHTVLSPVSPPAWSAAVSPGSVHFVASNQITTEWLAAQDVPRPPLAVAENCGVTALVLARWLGCAPLHLFGLDLALAPGAQRHTSGADTSLYTQSGFDAGQSYPEVAGNYAEKVPTHVIGDWRALERRLADWPAGLVVNVNDRGARLSNTTLLAPAQFTLKGAGAKADWLAALAGAAAADNVIAPLARLQAAGLQCTAIMPHLRAALHSAGPAILVPLLRRILADETTSRMLGGFALKLMPHLLPPIEGDDAFWTGLLDELGELSARAEQLK